MISFCKIRFSWLAFFWSSQVSKISFKVFSKSFGKFGSGFCQAQFLRQSYYLAKSFFGKRFGKFGFSVFNVHSFGFSKVSIAKNFITCKIKSVWRRFWFSGKASCTSHTCPTKRAPDQRDSAAFSSIFYTRTESWSSSFFYPHPLVR